MKKSSLLVAFKIVVSALSLIVLMRSADLSSFTKIISGIDAASAIVAIGVFWIAQVISSLRCVYIADQLGGELKLSTSVRAHFVGLWFNQVLPTSLGGDLFKVAILRQSLGIGVALRSVLLDRFSGLFILMLAIVITLPLYAHIFHADQGSFLFGLTVLSISFLVATVLLAWVTTLVRGNLYLTPLLSKLLGIISDIWLFRKDRSLWRQLWTSTIVHLNGIAAYALLGSALGFNVDLLTYVLIVPLIFLVALLPISFAGWGVRELGAIWLLGLAGVSQEKALVLSVTYGLMLLPAGIPGLVMYIFCKKNIS